MSNQEQMQEEKEITLKIPQSMDEKVLKAEVEKIIERTFGYVKVDRIRKRMGIKRLKKNVYKKGDEATLEHIRHSAKMRASIA